MTLLRGCNLLLLLMIATPVLSQTCPSNVPRVAPDTRYSITEMVASSGEFVVTDNLTGLMWKRCSEGQSGGACTGTATTHTWTAALTLANLAEHAGFDDWRLPNVEELRSLIETGCYSPSINTSVFPATVSNLYWSSTTVPISVSIAWVVDFNHGSLNFNFVKTEDREVRLVRGGQWLDTFSAEADGEPEGFSLAAQFGVPTSSVRTSDPITVEGLTTVTGIGVSGASGSTFSIDGGAFTSRPGAVANGDEVRIQHMSAATPATATTTTLNIGGVTADFVSTTVDVPDAPIIGTATAGDAFATVTFSAPGSDGGSATTGYTASSDPPGFSSSGCTASPCTVTGLSNGTAYTFTVTATNAIGTSDPSAASNSVTPRANQTITFHPAPTVVVDGTGVVSAMGGGSPNSVLFTSSTTDTCTVSGTNGSTVTGVTVGTCTIAANQAGSAAFNAAPQVTQDFNIGQGAQATLTATATPASIAFGGTSTLGTTGGSGEGAVSYAVTAGGSICSITDNTLTGTGVGTCTVTATKAADTNYTAATATVDVTVENAPPTISAPGTLTLLEDGSEVIAITVGDDRTPADELTVTATSDNQTLINDATLAVGLGGVGPNRTLLVEPMADANGTATVSLVVTDGDGASSNAALTLTVTPVNDPPSASVGPNQEWPAGTSGEREAIGFVSQLFPGAANEGDQTVTIDFGIDSNPNGVLTGATLDASGTLRYTLTGNSGAARLRLQAVDDGGTANGGIDRGEVATRRIVVGDGVDVSVAIRRVAPDATQLSDALAKGTTLASYTIEVRNNGTQDAAGVRIVVSPIIGLTDVLWTCGAPCTPPNGTNSIDTVTHLAAGGFLPITLIGSIDRSQLFVEITAQATLPAGTTVLLPDDDRQVLIEAAGIDGVYKSGFE